MESHHSLEFFDTQFRQQIGAHDFALNPFECLALPHAHGRVLDFGCGLGNFAVQAARQGCSVVALDASAAAISYLQQAATAQHLPLQAAQADLRHYQLSEDFDTVVSIGLLMFFDCPTAFDQLAQLQRCVRPGGTAVVNVLVHGTTYLDMFDVEQHCLFAHNELRRRFEGWQIVDESFSDHPAPGEKIKAFVTLVARKPAAH